jgi:hypothetical protein
MDYPKHKCIECKNDFYCYDNFLGCLCYKHKKWFKSTLFNNKIHNEITYCCSDQCNANYINELKIYKSFDTKYDIDRSDELIFQAINTTVELFKFFSVIIYFLIIFTLLILHLQ